MREKSAAARGLPAQRFVDRSRIDRDQEQIIRSCKMPRRRLAHLRAGGEVDESVSVVHRRTVEAPNPFSLFP